MRIYACRAYLCSGLTSLTAHSVTTQTAETPAKMRGKSFSFLPSDEGVDESIVQHYYMKIHMQISQAKAVAAGTPGPKSLVHLSRKQAHLQSKHAVTKSQPACQR